MLQVIGQLRQHVNLLGQYFELLQELATSDAPGKAQQAIGSSDSGLIGNLNRVGSQLRGSGFTPSPVSAAAGPITNTVVSGIIRGALKDELQLRKDTIQKELLLQEQLLSALSKKINHDLTITQQTKEQRLVIGPLTSPTPIANPDTWINNRRSVLTMKLTAEQLQTASNNIKKLRQAFDDLMAGKLTFASMNSLLADFSTLLTIAEKLKGQ